MRSSVDELRRVRLLGSSQRPLSRRRAHRFLKIDNFSAGVAAAHDPVAYRFLPPPLPRAVASCLRARDLLHASESYEDGFQGLARGLRRGERAWGRGTGPYTWKRRG